MSLSIFRRSAIAAAAGLLVALTPLRASAEEVVVFAAASLTNALNEIAGAWNTETGNTATISYAGSSALARQIQEGAPADVFISADVKWIEELSGSGDLVDGSRRDILGNTLVLIAHGDDAEAVTIDENLDLPAMLDGGRLSMALVDSVPAGVYGKAALTSLGLWEKVEPLVAQSDNVRAALSFVAQGEAPLGIVYATDAAVEDNVSVIGTFPAGSHEPIVYPVAITKQSDSPVTQEFVDYLTSDGARETWSRFGFSVLD